jgi:hypothetical protein
MNHGALVHIYSSTAVLFGWLSSMAGIRFPILALKSPHMTVVNCGCMLSSVSSIASVACDSGMLRFVSDAVGGR